MAICETCNLTHDGNYGSGRFCSQKCARSFSTKEKRQEINERVSKALTGKRGNTTGKILSFKLLYLRTCKICGNKFTSYIRNKNYCSIRCVSVKAGRKSAESQNRRSKNEIEFANLCLKEFDNIKINESIFNGWDADVIIEDYKVAILWNGKWHYEKITAKHSIKQVQNRDRIKIKEIEAAGYTPYVIKDMGKYNEVKVKKEFDNLLMWLNPRR